ncbi:hypothetical protein BH23GEM9_BH23GEM9_02310 [soil metagenome]
MGAILGAYTLHLRRGRLLAVVTAVLAVALAAAGCGSAPRQTPQIVLRDTPAPPLPDSTGWGLHVLALERAPDASIWVGTYGHGIYVLRPRATDWEPIGVSDDEASISWGFVNSLGFGRDSLEVWYGTVGNGFGRSTDGGVTWRNWTFRQLGPEWQYVAPNGIAVRRDTVYIATADGLRITGDGGATWRCIQATGGVAGGAAQRDDGCTERLSALPSKYLLALDVALDGTIWVGHLEGLSRSTDGGGTWTSIDTEGVAGQRVRALLVDRDTIVWVGTERAIFTSSADGSFSRRDIRLPGFAGLPGGPRAFAQSHGLLPPLIATSHGMVGRTSLDDYRVYYLGAADRYRPAGDMWAVTWFGPPYFPLGGSAAGLSRVLAGDLPMPPPFISSPAAQPADARHIWFARPVHDSEGNPHIDATYRYGSTMGGNFQQHQGVEFNNPAGTPVRSIGAGVVVFAGAAEAGANTVAIRHDRQWEGRHVFSTYYHNTSLDVRTGQRVEAGEVVARVGNTGRATNDHLHLEVHVAPTSDSAQIVDPDVRFPPWTVNPQLWIEPLPGTGVVAGVVFNAEGEPLPGARVYGMVLPYPAETPFSFAEAYREQARGSPAYGEHFAVGDVPAGDYTLGVIIDGRRIWRRARVAEGQVTWVEFRP